MDKILKIIQWKRLDRFLLLNYPTLWKYKLHHYYLIPLSFFYTIILYMIPFDTIVNNSGFISFLTFIFISIFMIIVIFMKVSIKVKLSGLKEYLLQLCILIFLTIPVFMFFQSGEYFWKTNKTIYNNYYNINSFKFENDKCIFKINKERKRSLDEKEEKFINIIIESFSENNITTVTEKIFEEATSKYRKLSLFIGYKNNIETLVVLLLILPFLKILSIYWHYYDPTLFFTYIVIVPLFLYLFIESGIININYLFLNKINIYITIIIFFLATVFIHLNKVILNYYTIFLILFGLSLYFFIFIFYMNLSILQAGFLVVLNILFIVSSLKEKLIILDARPKE